MVLLTGMVYNMYHPKKNRPARYSLFIAAAYLYNFYTSGIYPARIGQMALAENVFNAYKTGCGLKRGMKQGFDAE